jgi:hypothetical protein
MSQQDAEQAVRAYVASQFATIALADYQPDEPDPLDPTKMVPPVPWEMAWEGTGYNMRPNHPFCILNIIPGKTNSLEINPRSGREAGIIQIQVWHPDHEGMQAVLAVADKWILALRFKRLQYGNSGYIRTHQASIDKAPDMRAEGWVVVVVGTDYWRDIAFAA